MRSGSTSRTPDRREGKGARADRRDAVDDADLGSDQRYCRAGQVHHAPASAAASRKSCSAASNSSAARGRSAARAALTPMRACRSASSKSERLRRAMYPPAASASTTTAPSTTLPRAMTRRVSGGDRRTADTRIGTMPIAATTLDPRTGDEYGSRSSPWVTTAAIRAPGTGAGLPRRPRTTSAPSTPNPSRCRRMEPPKAASATAPKASRGHRSDRPRDRHQGRQCPGQEAIRSYAADRCARARRPRHAARDGDHGHDHAGEGGSADRLGRRTHGPTLDRTGRQEAAAPVAEPIKGREPCATATGGAMRRDGAVTGAITQVGRHPPAGASCDPRRFLTDYGQDPRMLPIDRADWELSGFCYGYWAQNEGAQAVAQSPLFNDPAERPRSWGRRNSALETFPESLQVQARMHELGIELPSLDLRRAVAGGARRQRGRHRVGHAAHARQDGQHSRQAVLGHCRRRDHRTVVDPTLARARARREVHFARSGVLRAGTSWAPRPNVSLHQDPHDGHRRRAAPRTAPGV